ncbi:MAG TPA: TMEM175 family protein [Candidatus Dormibacteraeota bacterium]|nr:TMEM175 family protein [Candidatus Dormibacteraeota bacterium]
MSKARVEAFSDGVFAIAITLLVLTLVTPAVGTADVSRALLDEWPGYAAYAVSFIVIGIMWVNHHALIARLAGVDRVFLFLNLLLLMTVVFLPYPTGVLGRFLEAGHGATPAAVMYSVTMEVNALAWTALWTWAAVGRRLLGDAFPADQVRRSVLRFGAGNVPYTATIAVAFVSAPICLALHGAIAVYYVVDQFGAADGQLVSND